MSKLPTPAFLARQIRRTRSLIDINNSLAEKNEKWLTIVPDMEDLEQSLADLGLEEDGDEEDGDEADNEEESDEENEERILIICELASNDHSHTPRGQHYRFYCKKCQKDFSNNSTNARAHCSAKNCSFEKDIVKQRFRFL